MSLCKIDDWKLVPFEKVFLKKCLSFIKHIFCLFCCDFPLKEGCLGLHIRLIKLIGDYLFSFSVLHTRTPHVPQLMSCVDTFFYSYYYCFCIKLQSRSLRLHVAIVTVIKYRNCDRWYQIDNTCDYDNNVQSN